MILSTDIAETSITVEDVTHVVDCGLFKEMRYDPASNVSSLQQVVISRASATQRSGRAGRVKPGHCWRLYSQRFFQGVPQQPPLPAVDSQPSMAEFSTPEIRRIPLEELILKVR